MKTQLRKEKKHLTWTIVLLSVILVLSAGCGSSGNKAESDAPSLTVVSGKTKIQAMRTTFSWQNGETGVEGDALHPLDMAEDLPVLEAPKEEAVKLSFDIEPDQVTVLVWKASVAGTDSYGDPEFRLPVSEDYTVTLPFKDHYIYQVHAKWNTEDGVGGSAFYGFASVPPES